MSHLVILSQSGVYAKCLEHNDAMAILRHLGYSGTWEFPG